MNKGSNENIEKPYRMNVLSAWIKRPMRPIDRSAKMAGLFYLIYLFLLPISTTLRSQMVVSGDAALTAQNIMANEVVFRLSIVTELFAAIFFVLAAWALYTLLRSVNKNVALLFFILNACGAAVQCMGVAQLSTALDLLSGSDYLAVIPTAQLQAEALLNIEAYHNGFIAANVFFGVWLLPLGYLVYRSGFLPRWLGVLLMADFVCVTYWILQFYLLPDYGYISTPGFAISFAAEVGLTLWLLVKGVKTVPMAKDGAVEN